MDLRKRVIALVDEIQKVPYAWPGPPDARFVREQGVGTCASKHALLAEELKSVGIASVPLLVVGPLVPEPLRGEEDCRPALALVEVHECLTALLPWAGPVRVDITWDPAIAEHGLPITRPWDGSSDMVVAVVANGPGWAVERSRLRAAKEALRSRLYQPGEREIRDRTLHAISGHFARWRSRA